MGVSISRSAVRRIHVVTNPHATSKIPPARVAICTRCRSGYDGPSWEKLPLLARLDAVDVRSFLIGWPEDAFIEVRSCALCQGQMARKRTRA
jgi:hypothetical protein